MATLWFMIVAVMVTAYVVLDGFDLGAGAIYSAGGENSGRAPHGASRDRSGMGRQRSLAAGGWRNVCISPFRCSTPPASAASIFR